MSLQFVLLSITVGYRDGFLENIILGRRKKFLHKDVNENPSVPTGISDLTASHARTMRRAATFRAFSTRLSSSLPVGRGIYVFQRIGRFLASLLWDVR
jgi:hypothetical protein